MSSGRTLVVHSGTYKTGSSSIQLYLARAEQSGDLAAGGATYPKIGRSAGIQHGNLNAELRGGEAFNPAWGGWDDLIASILSSDLTTTVLSSEHFSSLEPDAMRTMGEKCRAAGIKVRWIHYVRDQPGFYNAFYVERLVAMRPEFLQVINLPFEDFREWSPIDLGIMRYSTLAAQITEAIPDVELRLRPFSRKHLVEGDVVADFCSTAEIPWVPARAGVTNVGTGWRTTETARRLSPLVPKGRLLDTVHDAANPPAARMRWLALIRSALSQASTEVGWNDTTACYMTEDFRQRLLAEYHDDNVLVGKIGGFDFADIVESEPGKPYNVGNYDDVKADELMRVMQAVVPVIFRPPDEIQAMMDAGRAEKLARAAAEAPSLAARVRRRLRG